MSRADFLEQQVRSLAASAAAARTGRDAEAFRQLAKIYEAQLGRMESSA
jgi:UDP-N-acetylmuramyl tripeptide synthase